MSGISYDACRRGVNQPLGTGSTLPLHILFLNVDRQQRRAEPEVWQEQRWNEAERRTEIRRGPGWLTQSRMTHKYRQSETLLLSGPRYGRLYGYMTHPSPSFSRTSKTSSGCLVRLSSLSFFSCLQWQKEQFSGFLFVVFGYLSHRLQHTITAFVHYMPLKHFRTTPADLNWHSGTFTLKKYCRACQ